MERPVERAEEVIDAYRNYFIGVGGRSARSVANRFEATRGTDEDFVGIRGPFLQALDVPNWSDEEWTDFSHRAGLNPLLQFAFEQIGFRRLYDFQERAIQAIGDGENTVITAATGRGKTEAWLIPILDYILDANQGKLDDVDPDSVKATLIYPTKALAQDQLKRLIKYLYLINSELPKDQRITVGIYDGDTPTNMGSRAQAYLNTSFKYFSCPGYNDSLEKCRNCGEGVRVRIEDNEYQLQPERRMCTEDVPLEFVRLTKDAILNEGVDILLTNPDTINLKLINTNASDEHETFIYEPRFLVFDEVHTYEGLLGSYTATLTKRLRAMREAAGAGDLQVVASSATVENSVELFRKISGAESVTHIDEQPRSLEPDTVDEPPEPLVTTELSEDVFREIARGKRDAPAAFGEFEFSIPEPESYDNERLLDILSDELFDYFTTKDPDDRVVETLQYLHKLLSEQPRTRSDFVNEVQEQFEVGTESANRLMDNFRAIGVFSGLLENRSHLFSWPLDGFYTCLECDSIYRSPRETCTECNGAFVTRATYCRYCDDELVKVWFCPRCSQAEPYIPTEEGSQLHRDEAFCSRCQAARDEEVQMARVTFYPTLECRDCGQTEQRTVTQTCDQCGAPAVRTGPKTIACRNPACEATAEYSFNCSTCGSSDQHVKCIPGPVDCPDCGEEIHVETGTRETCDCGDTVAPSRMIPWVCGDDDCRRQYFQASPPAQCECGHTGTFARKGLFEVFEDEHCRNCDTAVLPGSDCGCDDPDHHLRSDSFRSYKTVTLDGRIMGASEVRSVVPCHHRGASYTVGDRFDELVRGPHNLAVTTSQYLLRSVADDEGDEAAKLLSFADSHRHMKELDRDFNEPEVETLLDQALIEAVERDDERAVWTSVDTVLEGAERRIETIAEELEPSVSVQNVTFDLKRHMAGRTRRHLDPGEAVRDRLFRRAVPHRYSRRFGERGGSLSENGLTDVRLVHETFSDLSSAERALLRIVVDEGLNCPVDEIVEAEPSFEVEEVLDGLADREVVDIKDGEYISIRPEVLEMATAGEADRLHYDPRSDTIYPTLRAQFGLVPDRAAQFDTSLAELADPTNPRFTERAYRTEYSSPRILVSQVYHGMTDKTERREIEYLFRNGKYPHFLSSGPTMELGVDIGALDALLLFGTPPNMNAYLQRVGRAGRRSNSALVHSVSQRNPIDFYYYDHPTELIAADPKPIPLHEHNEEVLRISLAWAVFDYIAANFVVPWEVEYQGRYGTVEGGDDFKRRSTGAVDDEYGKLTHLMSMRVKELGLEGQTSKLAALRTIVHDYRSQIQDYLEDVLGYQYCTRCSRKYEQDRHLDDCETDGCDGEIRDPTVEFDHLITEAIEEFPARFIDHYEEFTGELESEIQRLRQQSIELKRNLRRARSGEESARIQREKASIDERLEAIEEYLEDVRRKPYMEFLRESRQSKFGFNMRSVSNTVGLTLVSQTSGGDYRREDVEGGQQGREIRMAIKELHPGAAYLDSGDTYIVSHLREDEFESSQLKQLVREAEEHDLAEELVCPACHTSHPLGTESCPCDSAASLKRRRLVMPGAVEAYREDVVLSKDGDPARALQENSSESVQNTFTELETTVLSFDPERDFEIHTPDGSVVGTLSFGEFSVMAHTESYRAKYESGSVDPREQLFELCGEEDCTGVVYKDEDGVAQCSADSEHSPNRRGADSEYVRLGHAYQTEGIRVNLEEADDQDARLAHTFGHGLRVALQSLGGVSIRDIEEVVAEDHVDIFDAQQGGANISRLVIEKQDGEYWNFEHAVELMADHLECDCDDGCPVCLYQYGCSTFNRPRSFDKQGLLTVIQERSLELVSTRGAGSVETDTH